MTPPYSNAQVENLPGYDSAEVWIEAGHYSNRGAEWRIAIPEPSPTGEQGFWIPFSAPDGTALGWMRFCYITTVRQKAMFAATEWRSASEPAPHEQDLLPLPLGPLLAGFSPYQ